VPDAVVDELQAAFDAEPPADDPSQPPRLFERCEHVLADALGPVRRGDGGLSYVVPPGTSFESEAALLRSDDEHKERLHAQDLKRLDWTAEEWRQLIAGDLGPWAFVMDGDRVVSNCHTPRIGDKGAEAGTWTDPDYRGRGYAAAATAEWAELFAHSDRHLFYSTSADNVSSQRVAERLGLPLIGWMWQLSGV
jgi:RimJ/RimL family protein N-acetyltransferase